MQAEPDYESISSEAFGNPDAGDLLRQAVRHLSLYKGGFGAMRPPAQRRRTFDSLAKTAAKLKLQLEGLDDSDFADLFRRSGSTDPAAAEAPFFPSTAIAGPLRGHGYQDARTMLDLLRQLVAGAAHLAEAEPRSAAGRPERDDPITFGVESLGAIWRRHAGRPMTRSNKAGGFGLLAQQVLSAPPLSFSKVSVRHAVDSFLTSISIGVAEET